MASERRLAEMGDWVFIDIFANFTDGGALALGSAEQQSSHRTTPGEDRAAVSRDG